MRSLCSFILPISSLVPPDKPWSTSTPFLVRACFCLWQHFSRLCPPSNPSSPCLLSMSSYCCMKLHPSFDCHSPLRVASSPYRSFVVHAKSEKSTVSKKIWVVLFDFWCLQTWIPLLNIFSAKVLYFLHSPHLGAKCGGLMVPSLGGSPLTPLLLSWRIDVIYHCPFTYLLQFSLIAKM